LDTERIASWIIGILTSSFDGFLMNVDLKASAERQASICSVFANAKRVMILWSLAEQEKSVSDIASAIEASLQCTSQHLRLMKKMSILDSRRDGQTIYYRIVNNDFTEMCQLLFQMHQNER
jgi:DNA-binding transcriptional ArsR family regulator